MKTRRAWNHGHPAVLLVGLMLILFGLATLTGLVAMLYDESLSRRLVLLGIPTTLLTEVLGITAALTGGAIFAAAWANRRQKSS